MLLLVSNCGISQASRRELCLQHFSSKARASPSPWALTGWEAGPAMAVGSGTAKIQHHETAGTSTSLFC